MKESANRKRRKFVCACPDIQQCQRPCAHGKRMEEIEMKLVPLGDRVVLQQLDAEIGRASCRERVYTPV